jgi:hypothetical protein
MSNISNNEALESVLQKDFPNTVVEYCQQQIGGNVHVFLIRFSDDTLLEKKWRRISNAIAVYFQAKLSDEFGKWNTYLLFLTSPAIPRNLKYKIENDTLSSRKIVIDEKFSQPEIIKKYILNNDLELASKQQITELPAFQKNLQIADALVDRHVSGKVTYTADAKEVLKQIRESLKTYKDAI